MMQTQNLPQVLPFILRREKSQVLPELPAMTETVVKVSMSKIQRQIYASFCRGNHASTVLEKLQTEGLEGKALPSDLFKSLLFLRLVCTHPSMVFPSEVASTRQDLCHISSSGKLLALAELLREAGIIDSGVYGADNDCSVLYCADNEIRKGDDGFNSLISPVSDAAEAAAPIFSEKKVSKCLIFAQFSKSLDKVEELVLGSSAMQGRYLRLCGKTPPAERIDKCTLFQEDDNIRLMILTSRIGGLGLNLQAADKVIFLENDYNPQVDMQAIDRTRRIGQDRVVNVYKLITQDSVEEVILRMQREKLKLAKAVVSTENSSIFSMGTERLLDIFAGRAAEPKKQGEDDTIDLDGMLESCMEDYKILTASFFEQNII
jgi:TATA-binding protein-associated factor